MLSAKRISRGGRTGYISGLFLLFFLCTALCGCKTQNDLGVYPMLNHKFGTIMDIEGEILLLRPPDNEKRKNPVEDISLHVMSINGEKNSDKIIITLNLSNIISPPQLHNGNLVNLVGYESILAYGIVPGEAIYNRMMPQSRGYQIDNIFTVLKINSINR